MTSYLNAHPNKDSEEFDAVVTYLNAVSQKLSPPEFFQVASALHELVRRRKGEPRVWTRGQRH
jgi:hypothetical protein